MYICEYCNYKSTKKANYIRHRQSKAHVEKEQEGKQKKVKTQVALRAAQSAQSQSAQWCDICNRSYARKSTLIRHYKTIHPDMEIKIKVKPLARHKNNICNKSIIDSYNTTVLPTSTVFYQVNINQCKYCNKVFKSLFGQTKHEKICSEAKMKETIKEYEDKLSKMKMEKEQLVEMNKILADDRRRYAELSITNSKTTSKTMSMLSYLVYNYDDNPPLHEISTNQMKSIIHRKKPDNVGIVGILIMYHKEKSLDKYIGDGIISTYKKGNASQQSFHATDCSRLNYIIMDIVGDNEEWIYDGGGVKINQRIIGPICQEISQLLYEYIQDKIENGDDIDYEESLSIHEIRDQIDDGKMQKKINAYIAPHFETIKNESFSSRKKNEANKNIDNNIKKESMKIKYNKKSKKGSPSDANHDPIEEIE